MRLAGQATLRKTSALITAVWLAICSIHVSAVDVKAFVLPPNIYAETAVLMDADTGQVLYGKQQHKRMYPASLTKIMTCLLAMENGRYSDIVTVTEEGSSLPVVGTTHIALTEGEQLTLEQLTYATMVRSANDAANSVALHLSGSMPMFAKIMNERAAQLGAVDSHFVNASGLPDDNHYTTAYDLAVITRAAMQYPEFVKFAGTQKYVIPPTNKNKESRELVHGNYMFTLNDTYDGAYAGKTGWTEEAGQTLMTIAERNGVTLICVVMKSAGVTDAQFKDSTALFDYGFDNFRRVVIPEDRFPTQQIEYTLEGGAVQYARLYPAQEKMQVLLPSGVEESDLQIVTQMPSVLTEKDLARIRVEIRVPDVANEVMDRLAGNFPVEVRAFDMAAEYAGEPEKTPVNWLLLLQLLGFTLFAALIILLMLLMMAHKMIRLYYRALLRARCSRTHLTEEESYYLVMHVIDEEELEELRTAYANERRLLGVSNEDLRILREARRQTAQANRRRRALVKTRKAMEKERAQADDGELYQPPVIEKKSPPRAISRPVSGKPATPHTSDDELPDDWITRL